MKKMIVSLFTLVAGLGLGQEISGTYYVGEPNYDATLEHPWKRGFSEVTIEFDASKPSIQLTYDKASKPMYGFPHQLEQAAVKQGDLYAFTLNNMGPRCLEIADLLLIEPGIFVVQPATRVKAGCSEIERATKSNAPAKGGKVYPVESLVREFILGKDKARVEALCKNPAEYEKLIEQAVVARCKALNAGKAEKYPLPSEGMQDSKLKSEVNEAILAWAANRKWSQKVERSFIKSSEWETLRTGNKITGRQLRGVVIYSINGTCEWKEFTVRQDFNGSNYGKSYVTGEVPGGFSMACE